MNQEIRYTLYLLGLGMALVAYAHANFTTVSITDRIFVSIERIYQKLEKIDQRLYEIKQATKHD